jgi:hypothetical protein
MINWQFAWGKSEPESMGLATAAHMGMVGPETDQREALRDKI